MGKTKLMLDMDQSLHLRILVVVTILCVLVSARQNPIGTIYGAYLNNTQHNDYAIFLATIDPHTGHPTVLKTVAVTREISILYDLTAYDWIRNIYYFTTGVDGITGVADLYAYEPSKDNLKAYTFSVSRPLYSAIFTNVQWYPKMIQNVIGVVPSTGALYAQNLDTKSGYVSEIDEMFLATNTSKTVVKRKEILDDHDRLY